jgi:hypothetical protein
MWDSTLQQMIFIILEPTKRAHSGVEGKMHWSFAWVEIWKLCYSDKDAFPNNFKHFIATLLGLGRDFD